MALPENPVKAGDVKLRLQELLGIPADKRAQNIGPMTRAAFDRLAATPNNEQWPPGEINENPVHEVKASSFADPKDVAAFKRCKAAGHSDEYCFGVGDNGIGCWGDDTTADRPMCALPPEDWHPFGPAARGKKVIVTANGRRVICELRDTMPHREKIKNGAGIDLNPAAVKAIGLKPPIMVAATWQWA